MKIGLIQNEAVVGDLSQNLRQIVQGYRSCLDRGAELVIASAQALDGAFLQDLATRSSFRLQAKAALQALASETRLPLLLASCAGEPGETAQARPYLLCRGKVRPLRNHHIMRLGGCRFFVDVGASPTATVKDCDYTLHLPSEAWWPGQESAWRALITGEARSRNARSLMLRGVGCTEGQLMPGGSLAAAPDGSGLQLPLFEPGARIWSPTAKQALTPQPPLGEQLLRAVCYGLRSEWKQGGYEALAVDAAEPQAPLLLALARLAVGARHTVALIKHDRTEASQLAGKRRALAPALSADHGLLLLNGLTLHQSLLPTLASPAILRGIFAPLGELYESEIHRLSLSARANLPAPLRELLPIYMPKMSPAEENELSLLLEQNAAPMEILSQYPAADEARIRRFSRLIASAARRYGAPCPLRIRRQMTRLPLHHRLKE